MIALSVVADVLWVGTLALAVTAIVLEIDGGADESVSTSLAIGPGQVALRGRLP